MKECRVFRRRIADWHAGLLSADDEASLREHIAVCNECRAEARAQERLSALLREQPPLSAPPSFMTDLARRLEGRRERPPIMRRLFFPLRIKLPLEALGLAAMAAIVFMVYRPYEAERLPVRSEQAHTLPAPQDEETKVLRDTITAESPAAPAGAARNRRITRAAEKAASDRDEASLDRTPAAPQDRTGELAKKKDSAAIESVEQERLSDGQEGTRGDTLVVIEERAMAPDDERRASRERAVPASAPEKKRSRAAMKESAASRSLQGAAEARDAMDTIAALARSLGGSALPCAAAGADGRCRTLIVNLPAARQQAFMDGLRTIPGITPRTVRTGAATGERVLIRIERAP